MLPPHTLPFREEQKPWGPPGGWGCCWCCGASQVIRALRGTASRGEAAPPPGVSGECSSHPASLRPQATGVGGGEELGPEEWISYLLLFFLLLIIMENLTHTKVARTVVMNSKVSITTQLLVHGQSCFLFPSTPHLPLQIISKHVPGTISFYS